MKKFTLLLCAFMATTVLFGQSIKSNTNTLVTKDGKTTVVTPELKAPSSKATYLEQGFDTDPLEWSQQNTHATNHWFAGNPSSNPFSNIDPSSVSSALMAYIAEDCDEIIYSSSFDASASTNLQLSFYCGYSGPWMIGGDQAGGNGADVRAVISTDGGTTWDQLWSYSDTHNGNEAWAWELVEINLQATYGGQSNLIVGFQYYGNDGDLAGIDGVLVEDYVPPTEPDLTVNAITQNSMTPLAHAIYAMGATVINNGADLTTEQTLNINVTPGTYSQAITITLPFDSGADSTFVSDTYFEPTTTDTYEAVFDATFAADPTPDNNKDTVNFEVTDYVFGTDNGVIVGGLGSNTGPLTFGNIFVLTQADIVSSMNLMFSTVDADNDFTLSIYSVDPQTGAATHVFTSQTFTQTPAMSNVFTEFDIVDQNLDAGLYLFAIDQLDATNIVLGYDGVTGGSVYIYDSGTGNIGSNSNFGNVFLRVILDNGTAPNTETDFLTYSFAEQTGPATIDAGAHTIDIEVETGTDLTSLIADFTLSTGATATVGATPQVSGTTPNDFSSPVTYTVTAEDGTTTQDWIVTVTEAPDAIEGDKIEEISIYPNPANNVVTVANAENAEISIVNMLGQKVVSQTATSSRETVNISDLSNGTYVIRIEDGNEVITQKLNVVK